MPDISERDFRGVDLNLLVTLHVLLRERSVSRAAVCLHLGQPAVSGALARLRAQFGDPLLVRGRDGMQPTARAAALQAQLRPLLQGLRALVVDEPAFDPALAHRTFRIGLPDWIDTWLLPGLTARLAAEAPGLRLQLLAADRFNVEALLAGGEVDLALGTYYPGPAWITLRPVHEIPYRCVFRPDLLPRGAALTLERFIALPHLMVTYRAATRGTVDVALEALGLSREILHTSPRFSSLPGMLRSMKAIATVPDVLAGRWALEHGFASAPAPVELPPIQVVMAHHSANVQDAGLQWLAEAIVAEARGGGQAR